MAHLLSLSAAANERRSRGSQGSTALGSSPVHKPPTFSRLNGASDGFDRAAWSGTLASTQGSTTIDWQKPLPPVRFPLRDALISFQDVGGGRIPSPRTAESVALQAAQKGPLKVYSTQKSRAIRAVGKRRREGKDWEGRIDRDEPPLSTPRAPPEALVAKPAKKALLSAATTSRLEVLRSTESAGRSGWPVKPQEFSHESSGIGASRNELSRSMSDASFNRSRSLAGDDGIRPTWTSAARAVLAHSRRSAAEGKTHDGEDEDDGMHSLASVWLSVQRSKTLPRPVKEWVLKGQEFTDKGLGVGDRFELELAKLARRAPGPGTYHSESYGDVAKWLPDSSIPTKQPEARHVSTETHRMGARRNTEVKVDRQCPGPGTYELKGFADEILSKAARRSRTQVQGHSADDASAGAETKSPKKASH
eukprot:TRINITY_DN14109_c0_g1_i1.p1 TRINITY_DN14109_c0_g1~~TRINITY_DN14109_c0_g1_i1.p1  ORF type:complete len:420 (+),score=56.14 TRINITY_DN14109_c0_g1_i1:148-1407(+)